MIFLTKTAKKNNAFQATSACKSLRNADSYYLMEGRYFLAETALKAKKRSRVLPSCVAVILASFGVFVFPKDVQEQSNFPLYASSTVTVLKSSHQPLTASIDYKTMTIDQYDMRPVSADEDSGKLGIHDSYTDEDRINVAGLGSKPGYEIANAPIADDMNDQQMSVGYTIAAVVPADQKILSPSLEKKEKLELVASITPPSKDASTLPASDDLKTLIANSDAGVLALAYAPKKLVKDNPFAGVIRAVVPKRKKFIPAAVQKNHK